MESIQSRPCHPVSISSTLSVIPVVTTTAATVSAAATVLMILGPWCPPFPSSACFAGLMMRGHFTNPQSTESYGMWPRVCTGASVIRDLWIYGCFLFLWKQGSCDTFTYLENHYPEFLSCLIHFFRKLRVRASASSCSIDWKMVHTLNICVTASWH